MASLSQRLLSSLANPVDFFQGAILHDTSGETPSTNYILLIICAVFVSQWIVSLQNGVHNPQAIVSLLFIQAPAVAWVASPFFHQGLLHFVPNVLIIAVASPVEHYFSTREYLALFLLSGFPPLFIEGAKLAVLGTKPHVAAYGASAFAFGMLGAGSVHLVHSREEYSQRELLIILLGIVAGLTVLFDIAVGIWNPVQINLAHLGGLLVGACFGYLW